MLDGSVVTTADVTKVREILTFLPLEMKPKLRADSHARNRKHFERIALAPRGSPVSSPARPGWILCAVTRSGASITLYSDLSNTSGNNWGCGSANCRILDQVWGY